VNSIMESDKRNKDTLARVLIADSNNLFREKMKQIITDNFNSILTSEACNEHEVLNELSQHVFDLLILDLELSDGNGFNVLKKIMIITPDIPVLVISMFPVEQYEESVFRAGAHGYVSKVNLSNELIAALPKIFQGNRYFSSDSTGTSREKSI
jgi:two-component system, NarL family, invasion response regulator UvrY